MSRPPTILDSRGQPMQRRAYAPGGYLGAARSSRRSHLPGQLTDSRREYTAYVRAEMQRKARFYKKNFGMVRGVAKSLVDQAIGPGVFPLAATSSDAWNERAFKWFWNIAKICDVSRRLTLWEVQRDRTDAKFWDGEKFTVHLANQWPQLQLIRAHACGNFDVDEAAGWHDGVQLDSVLAPRAYRFRLRGDRYETVPAKSVVHSYMIEESDDVRGKTALTHAIRELNDMLDALALEMDAVKDNSRISRVLENESGEDEEPERARFTAADDDEPTSEGATHLKLESIFGAEVVRLKRGEKLSSYASQRPSPTFEGFIDWLGKLVTNGSGFPYEFAWSPNDLKGPGVRLILEKVRLACDEWRRNEVEDTYPFYTYAISWAMEHGELPYHPEFALCEWIGGAPDVTIDKGRDAQQDRENIRGALTTFKRYYAQQGLWWKTELRQRASEVGYLDHVAAEFDVAPERVCSLGNSPTSTAPGTINGETPTRRRPTAEEEEET